MRPTRVIAALACAAGLLLVLALLHHESGKSSAARGGGSGGQAAREDRPPAPTPRERRLRQALRAGVVKAAERGGQVEAAAMLDDSPTPLVAASHPGGANRYMRMWSMSKVATMVALLRSLGWRDLPGEAPSTEVLEALAGALTRSENCRQRRVVLELQRAVGGIPEARREIAEEFTLIGGQVVPGSQVAPPEALCVPFLSEQREIPDPLAPTLLLGTSRWRVGDAVRLAHALAVGTYGRALSALVLELMTAPKRPSRESEAGELTAPLDWGAGAVFGDLAPAYKAGWGGSLNGNFLAGQIAVIPLSASEHLSLAVVFHPDGQPVRDDPGITTAPQAIETVMRTVRSALDLSQVQVTKPDSGEFSGGD